MTIHLTSSFYEQFVESNFNYLRSFYVYRTKTTMSTGLVRTRMNITSPLPFYVDQYIEMFEPMSSLRHHLRHPTSDFRSYGSELQVYFCRHFYCLLCTRL